MSNASIQPNEGEMEPLTVASQLLAKGFTPIPLRHRGKEPTISGWPSLQVTPENIQDLFASQKLNVGVVLGVPSGGLIDLDFDAPETRQLARPVLRQTSVFGRKSNPSSHWLYKVAINDVPQRITFEDPEPEPGQKAMLLEIRGANNYTMFPGSIHPSGERVEWENDLDPTHVDFEKILGLARNIAAAGLLMRHWPSKGSRHDVTTALIGFLVRYGCDSYSAAAMATILNDGESFEKHRKGAEDAARRLDANKPVRGIPTLSEYFSEKILSRVLEWFGVTIPRDLIAMNEMYAVAWSGSQAVILKEHADVERKRRVVSFVDEKSMRLLYANRFASISNDDEENQKVRRVNLFDYWKTHPSRREYTGIVFLPGEEVPGAYNLWRGWNVDPNPNGSCALFLTHLREVICGGEQAHYEYVLAWMANAIQRPNERPGTCIVLRGSEGAGKGVCVQYFGALYGSHFVHLVHGEHFVGRFNAHMMSAALVYADEAFYAGDKRHDSVLKGFITEDHILLEQKYRDAIPVRNVVRLIMASNNHWTIPAGIDARRYMVLDVAETRVNDHAYFEAIRHEQENGGTEALMHFLLSYVPPKPINLRNPPKTEALLEQKHLTMDAFETFLYDRLYEGQLPLERDSGEDDPEEDWEAPTDEGRRWVSIAGLHEAFIKASGEKGERYRLTRVQFGKRLMKILGDCVIVKTKSREDTRDYLSRGEPRIHRVRCYGFINLAACRAKFEEVLRQKVDWPRYDED